MDSENSDSGSSSLSDVEAASFGAIEVGEELNITIEPYQFEPEFSSSSGDERDDDESPEESDETQENAHDNQDRTLNSDWCTCENCQAMHRKEECLCCQECEQLRMKLDQLKHPLQCITQHAGFIAVCLNETVLEVAWLQYKQQYFKSYEGPKHKLNRHIAYRQFVRWCYGILGREIRVSLPSCVVCSIRAHFPPPGLEEDFQFEGFHFPDE